MTESTVSPPVVVGVDGSTAGVRAALWAVDEAVSRDVPLRLLSAIDPDIHSGEDEAHRLATAEIAVRFAYTAVEAAEPSVKLEIEIVQENPLAALLRASSTAAMICVGAVGFRHFSDGRTGSTAEMLAAQSRCPVAIVRDRRVTPSGEPGWVVAIVDEAADRHAVLQAGVEEAKLRQAPLYVVASRHAGDDHAEGRLARALAQWTRRNPGLAITSELLTRGALHYLVEHAAHTQLVVVGAHHTAILQDLFSATGYAALHSTQCSVLIANVHRAL